MSKNTEFAWIVQSLLRLGFAKSYEYYGLHENDQENPGFDSMFVDSNFQLIGKKLWNYPDNWLDPDQQFTPMINSNFSVTHFKFIHSLESNEYELCSEVDLFYSCASELIKNSSIGRGFWGPGDPFESQSNH